MLSAWLAWVPQIPAADGIEAGVDPALDGWVGLEDVDEAVLLDLDELLQNPVSLTASDVHRLRWVPWIGRRQWESLVRALPVRSIDEWTRLPGWSTDAVERLLPFVALPVASPGRRTRQLGDWQSDVVWLRSGTRTRVQATRGPVQLAAQIRHEPFGSSAGALSWRSPSLWVHLGDQRRSTALGLLWSGRLLSSRAGGPVHSAPRWSASTSAWRDRVVRGVGVSWRRASLRLGAQHGDLSGERIVGASVTWQKRAEARVQVTLLRHRGRNRVGLFMERGPSAAQCGVELVVQPQGSAAGFFVRRNQRRVGLEAMVILAPRGVSSPLAGTPRAARDTGWVHARMRATWSTTTARLRVAWAQSVWSTSQVRQDDLLLQVEKRFPVADLEARWRGGRDTERAVETEALGAEVLQWDERLLLRARLDFSGRSALLIERRSRVSHAAAVRPTPATGWRLSWVREWNRTRWDVSVASFDAVVGESLVFSEPAVGRAPALFTASARGMRLAVRLRHEWRGWLASLRAAGGWQPDGAWRPVVEGALRFRTSGTNGF